MHEQPYVTEAASAKRVCSTRPLAYCQNSMTMTGDEGRHCEERSDEAIQGQERSAPPWIAAPPSGGSQ